MSLRRRLLRASAWLLVQVATQVFPFYHIEEWVMRRNDPRFAALVKKMEFLE